MAAKRLAGVAGVLGTVVSTPQNELSQQSEHDAAGGGQSVADSDERPLREKPTRTARKTRLGRPPGPTHPDRPKKRKATVWIKADVLDDYHDWSWDERCQLGELIERALIDYRNRRRGH